MDINLNLWHDTDINGLLPPSFVERTLFYDIQPLLKRNKIIFILGPRQSGKSSLMFYIIKYLMDIGISKSNINYISMDYEKNKDMIKDSVKFVKFIEGFANGGKIYVFIDEIQRLKNAGIILKQIYDMKKNIQLIVSGSSFIDIKDKVKEHLTGRRVDFYLYPFSFEEFIRTNRNLPNIHGMQIEDVLLYKDILKEEWERFCTVGGYPEIAMERDEKMRGFLYESIYSSYLDRDIKDLIMSANFDKFKKFVTLMSANIGKVYKRDTVASRIGVNVRTVEKFEEIGILTFIWDKIKPFYSNVNKELRKSPKFYFIDNGLMSYISGRSGCDDFVFENVVFTEIKKMVKTGNIKWWRTKSKAEVDFIIEYKDNDILPIEVKGGIIKKDYMGKSAISFIKRYNPNKFIFVTKDMYDVKMFNKTRIYYVPAYLLWKFIPPIYLNE